MLVCCKRRRALTVVELLVAIAIVVILLGLLLPAVQYAREAARQATCKNNLRQHAIALVSYHDLAGFLPINIGIWNQGPWPTPQKNGKGWLVSILPQLENNSLYQQFLPAFEGDFLSEGGLKNFACRPANQVMLAVSHCPSDTSILSLSDEQHEWKGIPVALASYKGVLGSNRLGGPRSTFPSNLPDCHADLHCSGLFWRLSYQDPQRLADIIDGTSNTLMLGEIVGSHTNHATAYYSNSDWASCHIPLNFFPNPPRKDDWWDVMSFRSRHPDGSNFGRADGSVVFLKDVINVDLYHHLATKNGREPATE